MIDIVSYLPAKRKTTAAGWISVNAPCCVHNGESADRRQRGGFKPSEQGWSWHCFNCGYTASFKLGRHLSLRARRLLSWLGVPQEEIERINLESLRHRSMEGLLQDRQQMLQQLSSIEFQERNLPRYLQRVTPEDFPVQWQYLENRAAPMDLSYWVQDNGPTVKLEYSPRPHVIVPFTHNGVVVGYTMRYLDDRRPKYISDTQENYVFGSDLQRPDWQHLLVMEGVFDALAISGMAVLHADISDGQAKLIRSLGRDITVVPDHDSAGMRLVDRALDLGWAVSMPPWEPGIKDVNDAVLRYGRLGALLTIMGHRETSRIKIELRRKQLAHRL